jgi:hypothetical protein
MENPGILVARSIWLFNTSELNPLGVALAPLYESLRERYQFLQYPCKSEDFAKSGLSFKDGNFSGWGVNLEIYADGIIASTHTSTRVSDAFLEDVLVWAKDNFKLRYDPLLIRRKLYESNIEFTSKLDLKKEFKKLNNFLKLLSEINPDQENTVKDIVIIAFKDEKVQRALFTFEKRENTPFSENRYVSGAAYDTDKHLELIEKFENLMKAKA